MNEIIGTNELGAQVLSHVIATPPEGERGGGKKDGGGGRKGRKVS